jgi:folate receptor
MRKASSFWCVLACLLAGGAEVYGWETCSSFGSIYANGQELCEIMWNDAFKYETDEDNAYTMWYFDENNPPNDAITAGLGFAQPDTCGLSYYHKDAPSAEGDDFTECHPWKQNACCHESTTTTVDALRDGYGPEYKWDRCGPMTQACERFFVQEACFYECEVAAGLYRKFTDEMYNGCTTDPYSYADNSLLAGTDITLTAPAPDGSSVDNSDGTYTYTCTGYENTWQMYKMPIKASYCDAWYNACLEDSFCGDGDYFSCAQAYIAPSTPPSMPPVVVTEEEIPDYAIAIIVVGGILLLVAICGVGVLVSREKAGMPIFTNLESGPPMGSAGKGAPTSQA